MKRTATVLLVTLLATAAFMLGAADSLTGIVTDEAGAPVAGVFVSAHGPNEVTTTAITNRNGRYELPGLDAAAGFDLTVSGIGFETLEQANAQPNSRGEVDFQIHRRADVYDQLPSSQFLGLLPESETKRQFILDCTGCHQFDRQIIEIDGKRKSQAQWIERIEQMLSFSGAHTQFPVMSPSRDASETAAWLTTHLGRPGDPRPQLAPPAPMTDESSEVIITEYPIPAQNDLPHDLMPMADGRVLITGMMTHQMYTLDPASGAFGHHPIPVQFANPRALTIDEDGVWWVLLGYPQKVAAYDPSTDAWQAYDLGMYPHSILRAEDGRIWFNGHFTKEPELIGYLDPATGDVKTYEVPVPAMPDGGSTIPYGLRLAPDGTLWGTELVGNRLVKFMPATETFAVYDLPTTHSGPRRLDVAPDGTVWIPQYAANQIAHFDPGTETFTEYTLPMPDTLPYIVRVAPTGHIWVATAAADAVFRFDPATEAFTTFRLPTHRALIRHMELDPATGDVWVAYGNSPSVAPKVARLEVRN